MRRRPHSSPVSLFSFQDIITGLCGIMVFLVLVQVVDVVLAREEPAGAEAFVPDLSDSGETDALRGEIATLERSLETVRRDAAMAVVPLADRVKPGEFEKTDRALTERERQIAALVSQIEALETKLEKRRDADAKNRERLKEMERSVRRLERELAERRKRDKSLTLIAQRGSGKIPVYAVCSGGGLEVHFPFDRNRVRRKFAAGEAVERFDDLLSELDHTTHCVVLLVRPSGVRFMDAAVRQLEAHAFTYGRDPLEESVPVTFGREDAG